MGAGIPVYPDLAGKVAVVTGSFRGIGTATCRLLARGDGNPLLQLAAMTLLPSHHLAS